MKLSYVSDVHCEFHKDSGTEFISKLPRDSDVLVVAGDLCTASQLEQTLSSLAANQQEVIYVPGNHEYYDSSLYKVRDILEDCVHDNLHILTNKLITLHDQRFLGTTLWFQNEPENIFHQNKMADFKAIKEFSEWVYEENFQAKRFLENNLQEGDVVVTHHLPSYKSVASMYSTSNLNRFFVSDMEELVLDAKPKLWIHGHTHSSVDYMLGDTRVVCNPFGYAAYETNSNFNASTSIVL